MKQNKLNKTNIHNKHNFWLKNWYQHKLNICLYVFVPLSILFRIIIFFRKLFFYKKRSGNNKPKIIIIGNLTIGGTGKTPLIIKIASDMLKKGLKIGVISRGYGGEHAKNNPNQAYSVKISDRASYTGDEPLLIKQSLANLDLDIPVVICCKRVNALKLLENKCDVILSDDGLQHYALPRDIEILVVDGSVGFGNGWVMPAGPLREPLSRIKSVDHIIINHNSYSKGGEQGIISSLDMRLKNQKFYKMHLAIKNNIMPLNPKLNKFSDFYDKKTKICALCAIGRPERFFSTLNHMGFKNFEKISLLDHQSLSEHELLNINADIILMTEKDAVKYTHMKQVVSSNKFWVVGVEAICDTSFLF